MLYEIKIKCDSIIPENITEGMLLAAFTYINTEKSINYRKNLREYVKNSMKNFKLLDEDINKIFVTEDLILELTSNYLEIYINDNILKLNANFDIDLDETYEEVIIDKIWRCGIHVILVAYIQEYVNLINSGIDETIVIELYDYLYNLENKIKIEANRKLFDFSYRDEIAVSSHIDSQIYSCDALCDDTPIFPNEDSIILQ